MGTVLDTLPPLFYGVVLLTGVLRTRHLVLELFTAHITKTPILY